MMTSGFAPTCAQRDEPDMADIAGQAPAKRALEIAAAGGHGVLLVGPSGAGKTMLAQRLATILPPLSAREREEMTMIWWGAGAIAGGPYESHTVQVPADRPFRAPHHTVSEAGMFGIVRPISTFPQRGTRKMQEVTHRYTVPGEVSMAHGGVLFLDELPEFRRPVLETIARSFMEGFVRFSLTAIPAGGQLIGACNPCPCGWAGSSRNVCRCSPDVAARYLARMTPMLPVLPIRVTIDAIPLASMGTMERGESSAIIRERVIRARQFREERDLVRGCQHPRQRFRLHSRFRSCVGDFHPFGSCEDEAKKMMSVPDKIARTIADLEGSAEVRAIHLMEARDLYHWKG
jgi:magnesium chelatase family protein